MPDFNDIFVPFQRACPTRPFVVAQIGQSLDGRVATVSGESRDISGPTALDHLHRLRAHVDAVVVGAGTVEADDPSLTVRRVEGRNPARVVIDPRGRTLGTCRKWLAEDGARRILIGCCPSVPAGVEQVRLGGDGPIAPAEIIRALHERGLRRILIEGGPRTIAAFLDAGCLDRLHVLIAPVIIGSGRPGLDLPPEPELALARRPQADIHLLGGGDVLYDCDLSAGADQGGDAPRGV